METVSQKQGFATLASYLSTELYVGFQYRVKLQYKLF